MFDYDVMNDTLDIDLDEDNANIIQTRGITKSILYVRL
jgi:hypothetical protein